MRAPEPTPKSALRTSTVTSLSVDIESPPRVLSSPTLPKQPGLLVPSAATGRLTIRILEGSDFGLPSVDAPAEPAPVAPGLIKSIRRASLGMKRHVESRVECTASICIVIQIGTAPVLEFTTSSLHTAQDKWHEEFAVEAASTDDVLMLYGVDRMKNGVHKSIIADSWEDHNACFGKVCIPLSRLPEHEEIEQWYSFSGTRAAVRVALKFSPTTSSLPPLSSPTSSLRPRAPSATQEADAALTPNDPPTPLQEHVLPSGIIDYVVFVGPDADQEHVVLHRYPKDDRKDFPLPTKIEWFCFPGGYETISAVAKPPAATFSYALIGGHDGLSRCYGVCLVVYHIKVGVPPTATGSKQWEPTCICFLSRLPLLPQLQTVILHVASVYLNTDHTIARRGAHIVDQLTRRLPLPISGLLDVTVSVLPGAPVRFAWGPAIAHKYALPPPLYSLETFFLAFPLHTAVRLVVLALCEYRVVVHSAHLSLLCPVTESLKALLYPFRWQHPYVPMLPRILSEYLQAPLPYILGVQTAWLPGLFEGGRPDNLVLVDIDRGTLNIGNEAALPPLPTALTKALYARLKAMLAERWSPDLEHRIRLSFVCYLTAIIRGYRDCLFFVDSGFPVFNKRRFLATTVSPERTPFVTRLVGTQAFEAFLENHHGSRLDVFHAIYQTLSQTDEVLWLEEPTDTPTVETKELHVVLHREASAEAWTLPDVTAAIQSSDLSILEQLKLKPPVATPRSSPGVWTYEKVADQLGMERAVFEANWAAITDPFAQLAPPLHVASGRELSSEEEKVQESIHKCLVSVFSSEGLSENERLACQRAFKEQYARELFVLILMQPHQRAEAVAGAYNPRGSGSCLGDVGFNLLVALATQVLQDCEIHEDYTNARGLLQVSAQFYRLLDDGSPAVTKTPGFGAPREYLQKSLKTQPICRSLDMWHHALSRDIEAALKLETLEPGSEAAIVPDDMFFSQMGSLVYDMLNLETPLAKVQLFVTGMCSTYNRAKEVQETLQQLVENLNRALVLSSDNLSATHSSWALASQGPASTAQTTYELDSVIRRRISTATLASSSKSSLPPDLDDDTPHTVLFQTQSPIMCLALHRDRVAAGCLNSCIYVTGGPGPAPLRLQGHLGAVGCLQLRGDLVFSGALDATVRVWDLHEPPAVSRKPSSSSLFRFLSPTAEAALVATPNPLDDSRPRTLKGHSQAVSSLEVGRQLGPQRWCIASGSAASIRVWDSGKETSVALLPHVARVQSLKFLTGTTTLVSGDSAGDLDVWDVATGRKKAHFAAHRSAVTDLQLAGDRLVSAATDRSLKVWDARFQAGQCCTHVLVGHTAPVTCVALGGPADPTICSGSADGTVKVWDLRATGRGARLELAGHTGRVTVLQRDFTKVISGSEDGTLRAWNMHTGACSQVLEGHASGITAIGVRDSAGPNLISASWDGTVRVWNVSMES
ncbi:hypothetical protein ACHHYP_03448 [Achlya hypogyna]|uniref:UDENN domain-containing protein n=1 Tax=Achlya hypogyna TaxID=1202772 RepID=A0A1V9ZRB0_ACHHY|nr:hypothetical protein ACHHYP_03448 [Achlya hypogyna]